MKKIINIVCWIFILYLSTENINFVYAQNEIIEDTQTNEITNELGMEGLTSGLEIMQEQNSDSSTMVRWAPVLWTQQTIQTIDTSDYGIIRIKDPNNTGKWITMLDRNLWATATWAWIDESKQSFWYYFQWWNNYGFPSDPNEEISTTTDQADASGYWPNTENGYYSSNVFIKWNSDWSSVSNDNLRWWSGDSRDGNNRWYPLTNPEDRRWPCPENYHIPSIWEWSKVLEFRASEYDGVSLIFEDNGLYKFKNNSSAVDNFNQRFHLSFAGQRNDYSIITSPNIRTLLRSSSPNDLNKAFRLYWESSNIFAQQLNLRVYAFPIRCFYDSYWLPVKITYNVNWWHRTDDENVQQKIITYTKRDDNSQYSWDILLWKVKRHNNCWENKDKKCIFGWWFTLTDDELWTWNLIEDITVYAKWLEFNDNDISYSGVNFTIIDRNLWAVKSWIDENAYGYYLTWWEKDVVCPEWYHVPNAWEWIWIKKLLGSDFNWSLVKSMLNLPFAGKVENDAIIETGENGYYLTKNGDETMYAKISNSNIEIEHMSEWEKVSIRCFKDYSVWIIKFNSNGWNNVADIETVNWRKDWENLTIPTREHSDFLWWYNQDDVKIEKNVNYKNEEEINLYAKWECEQWYQENENKCEKISKPSGWSSGWGGKWSNIKDINMSSWTNVKDLTWNTQNSSIDNLVSEWQISPYPSLSKGWENDSFPIDKWDATLIDKILQEDFPQEFIDAYNFAYKNWITTKTSIYDAKMYSPLIRIQMAKMLSYYAINILWKRPDVSKWMIKFDDISNELNKKYDNAITLAYQLGIMWQNIKDNKFRPYDKVSRAEFATALSRLLYWIEDWEVRYYEPHLIKLYNKWIIKNKDPKLEEKRWYVMIILLRATDKL